MPRRTRPRQPKVRRAWTRDPATRAHEDRHKYDRKRVRREEADDFDEAILSRYDAEKTTLHPEDGRILGIDYGERRVGLAVSDPTGRIAQGLDTLEADSPNEILDTLVELISKYEARLVVIGMPMRMDGTPGEMAQQVEAFAGSLKQRTGVEVIPWDERLTSASAQRAMVEMGQTVKGRKGAIDRISATLILQAYLDSVRG